MRLCYFGTSERLALVVKARCSQQKFKKTKLIHCPLVLFLKVILYLCVLKNKKQYIFQKNQFYGCMENQL